ncbi:MAG: glutamine synthetase, partial [Rhodoferax sp.]|nr:glutamine synthetase [Actinomycetota bacterium]
REGNSCHVHCSLRGTDGSMVLADEDDHDQGLSATGRAYVAGQLDRMHELTLLLAPNINSYKRFVAGSFAPTALRWGRDNRTCAFRLVGHGPSLRLENRIPGGDVNPYLATAAIIAAGFDGIERGLELEPPFVGNAYTSDSVRVPESLPQALQLWESSDFARRVFGDDVVEHYANMARVEIASFQSSVTDWERYRGFERL